VYLIDFGLARTAGDKGLTTACNTLGTLGVHGAGAFRGRADRSARRHLRADLCALRVHHGSRPYPAESYEQQIKGHMVSPPPRPSAIDPKLAAFDSVIARGHGEEEAGEAVSDGR